MLENNGEMTVFNPAKDIAKEITLQILIKHRDAMTQAREGAVFGSEQLSEKEKKLNKVKGLFKIISAQREMINISRPIVRFNCFNNWKRKYQSDEEKEENPFEKEDNDYNKLLELKAILSEAEQDIIEAEKTPSQKDDYLVEKITSNGKKFELTRKYFEMIDGLEDLYESIDFIMLKYKIISSGIEEDEIKTYKEKEQEAIRRIVEA